MYHWVRQMQLKLRQQCMGVYRAFVRMYGTLLPRELPRATYALFAVRDARTMMSSFSAPSWLSSALKSSTAPSVLTDAQTGMCL